MLGAERTDRRLRGTAARRVIGREATGDDGTRRRQTATRPISVAELTWQERHHRLAAGGLGSSPQAPRQQRTVTVAELTGEIPIVRLDDNGCFSSTMTTVTSKSPASRTRPTGMPTPMTIITTSRTSPPRAPRRTPCRIAGRVSTRASHYRVRRRRSPSIRAEQEMSGEPEAMTPDPIDDAPAVSAPAVDDELGIGAVDEPDAELFSELRCSAARPTTSPKRRGRGRGRRRGPLMMPTPSSPSPGTCRTAWRAMSTRISATNTARPTRMSTRITRPSTTITTSRPVVSRSCAAWVFALQSVLAVALGRFVPWRSRSSGSGTA